MKYYVLYNPIAGHGSTRDKVQALSSVYEEEVVFEDLTSLSYQDFLGTLNAEDVIILCGGDGTLNRFINDTVELDFSNDVLYYPVGTGNDFMHDIGKSNDTLPFSVKEYIRDLPVVEVKGKTYRFLNNVGFGIEGYCCAVGDEIKKTSTKPVNYTTIAIKGLLFHFKPVNAKVTVDGQTYEYKKVWLAPTMKGRYFGGGMMPTPRQDRNDPTKTLSVLVLHDSSALKTLTVFPSIFKGEHIKHTKIFTTLKGQEITVTFDRPTPLQIDGETILDVTTYHACAKAPAKVNA